MAIKNIKIDFTGLSYDSTSTFNITSNVGDSVSGITYDELRSDLTGYDFTISDTATSITVQSSNGVCGNIPALDTKTFEAVGITPTPTNTPPSTPIPGTPPPTPTNTPPPPLETTTVLTGQESSVGTDTFTLNGNIGVVGVPNYTQKGFVWMAGNGIPDMTDNIINIPGTSTGTFSQQLNGLSDNSTYSYRAFAVQGGVTTYGTTEIVQTTEVVDVYYSLEKCIDSTTGWRTQQTISGITLSIDDRVEDPSGFFYKVTGTTNSPLNNVGIVTDTGLTLCPTPPAEYQPGVTTNSANPTTTTTLTLNGTITDDGNPAYTSKGFYWKLGTSTPTASDNVITLGNTGTGLYSSQITGLTPGTQYTYVAWATNTVGTSVGSPSTTITNVVAKWGLIRCDGTSGPWLSTQTTEELPGLINGDRVTDPSNNIYIVNGTSNSGTEVGLITDTGEQSCPTTERFYNMELCDDTQVTFVGRNDSSENLAVGSSLKNNGTCYRVGTETTTSGLDTNITSWERFNTCTACANSIPPSQTPSPALSTTYHVFEDCTDGSFVAAAITAPINSSERYVDFNVSPQKYYAYTNNSVTDTTGYTVNNNLVPTSFDHTDQGCPPPQPSPTPVNNSWVITSGATNVSLTTGQASTNTNSFFIEVGTSPRTMKVKLNWQTGTANANASVTIGGQTITVGPFTLPSTNERISTVSIPLNANTSYAGSVTVNGTSSGGTFAVLQATALIE